MNGLMHFPRNLSLHPILRPAHDDSIPLSMVKHTENIETSPYFRGSILISSSARHPPHHFLGSPACFFFLRYCCWEILYEHMRGESHR